MMRRLLAIVLMVSAAGCGRSMYDAKRATRPYPQILHKSSSVDIQAFPEATSLTIVNSTPRSYGPCDVWINQRYMSHLKEGLPAGATVTMSLWDFWDERGDRLAAGGFWRTERPTPVRMIELQVGEEKQLVGLVTVPAE
jgi:hypothetical protein